MAGWGQKAYFCLPENGGFSGGKIKQAECRFIFGALTAECLFTAGRKVRLVRENKPKRACFGTHFA
jgi:hypothetical protein